MSLFNLSPWLEGTWEQVRGYLHADLEHLVSAVNRTSTAQQAVTVPMLYQDANGTHTDATRIMRGVTTIKNGQTTIALLFPSAFTDSTRLTILVTPLSVAEVVIPISITKIGCTLQRVGNVGDNRVQWQAEGLIS